MNQEFSLLDDKTSDSSPEMRAKRLKRLRNLANLTREQMCEDGKINRNTLIGWENARFGGLTLEGAKKVLARISHENQKIYCSLEWLMYGIGQEPSVNPIPSLQENESNESVEFNEDMIIAYELAFFKSKNSCTADLIVSDKGMLPTFQIGDCVAGKKKTGKDIHYTIGYDCIVETDKGALLLRNVREGKDQDTYTLICNNPAVKEIPSIITDVKLIYSAPVIWHRKKDIIIN